MASPQIPGDAEDGLIGRWPLDEGQGTNVVDVSSNAWHGTLEGVPLPQWTSGVSSNALGFDGIQNEFQVPHEAELSPTNALALTAWVKASPAITGEILAKWSTNVLAGSYLLSFTNGLPQMELMLDGNYTAVTGETYLIDTNWHHVVGMYDGAEMKLYLDTELVVSVAASGTVDNVEEPVRVGLLGGRVDDVRVYNRDLSTNEVAALYFADSDGDGLSDRYEVEHGLNPNDPSDGTNFATSSSNPCPGSRDYQIATDPIEVTMVRVTDGGPRRDPFTVSGGTVVWQSSESHQQIVKIDPQTGPVTITVSWDCDPDDSDPGPELTVASGVFDLKFVEVPNDKDLNPGGAMFLGATNTLKQLGFSGGIPCTGPLDQNITVSWTPADKIRLHHGNTNAFPITNGTTVKNKCSTNFWIEALLPGEVEITMTSYTVEEKVKLTIHKVQMLDAQGFEPQWEEGSDATLELELDADVDTNEFGRVGALTDGSSLVIVRSQSTNQILGTVKTYLEDKGGANPTQTTPEALGSLFTGSNTQLPPLPASVSDPGTHTLSINDGSFTTYYRPPPSWYFDKTEKVRTQNVVIVHGNLTNRVTWTLHKPPLVLVHGLFGSPNSWNGFSARLATSGFAVDTSVADYGTHNTAGFDAIYLAVPVAIRNAVTSNRTAKVAATRVDVVAHSMGTDATRWYMMPSADLPDKADRGNNAVEPLLFKTPAISAGREVEDQFQREDDFGVGDIRRFVTLGGVHTGTSICWQGIRMVNKGIRAELERRKEHLKVWTKVEQTFKFQAIAFDESGDPDDDGMALVDLAARTHPFPNGSAPEKSVALNAFADVPVAYAPVEGVASGGSPVSTVAADLFRIIISFRLGGVYPSDVQPANSDMCVPSLSARNLNPQAGGRTLNGVNHWNLTDNDQLNSDFFGRFFGEDEASYEQP